MLALLHVVLLVIGGCKGVTHGEVGDSAVVQPSRSNFVAGAYRGGRLKDLGPIASRRLAERNQRPVHSATVFQTYGSITVYLSGSISVVTGAGSVVIALPSEILHGAGVESRLR